MKKLILVILIILLVVLFGTYPLSILSKIWDFMLILGNWIGVGIKRLAKVLNFFGWNGLI